MGHNFIFWSKNCKFCAGFASKSQILAIKGTLFAKITLVKQNVSIPLPWGRSEVQRLGVGFDLIMTLRCYRCYNFLCPHCKVHSHQSVTVSHVQFISISQHIILFCVIYCMKCSICHSIHNRNEI